MTAEIFRRHGVFFGNTHIRGEGRMGYNEHPKLKQLVRNFRRDCYQDIVHGRDPELHIGNFPNRWTQILMDDGWDGNTPWGAKVDVFCHRMFNQLDPQFVGLLRDRDAIVDSCERSMPGRFTTPEWEKIVDAHHKRLKELDIPLIDTDKLVEGDWEQTVNALDLLGLGFSEDIANSVIDGRG